MSTRLARTLSKVFTTMLMMAGFEATLYSPKA